MDPMDKTRREMVEFQLKARGIKDERVLSAMGKVPRHLFVPENIMVSAYDDCALPIGLNQTISQPYMVAIMTESLGLKGDEKVLEVGTGSGYQAAVLAEISKQVITIERLPDLAETAEDLLKKLGYSNVRVLSGDGTEGYEPESPYEGIIVTAGCPDIPQPLIKQLKAGGRLVIPVGERFSQILTVVHKGSDGKLSIESSIGCIFVPLIGKFGWKT